LRRKIPEQALGKTVFSLRHYISILLFDNNGRLIGRISGFSSLWPIEALQSIIRSRMAIHERGHIIGIRIT